MKEKTFRLQPVWKLALVCWVLFLFLIFPTDVFAQSSLDSDPSNQPQSAEECLACHSQSGQTLTLPSGEVLSTTIQSNEYALSVHGSQGFKCTMCHENYSGFPHPERDTQNSREYTIEHSQVCLECHPSQYEQLKDSVHYQVMSEGNDNAPVCSDCHNPHAQSEFGQSPLQLELALTSHICAQCHNSIFVEYAQSVHGVGLFQENNSDVPTCADCHGIHSIEDPRTEQARLNSPQLCAECHTNPAIMDKYGISTDVLKTYVADFHGTTVTLFEKISPDQPVNTPVCYDCHGVHNISAVDDPEKGLDVRENLLSTCQRCHPDANINFPDSWLGHYIPSPEKAPWVYYVQQFYKFFIPMVLGGMAVFVVTDIGRTLWGRLRKNSAKSPSQDEGTKEK
jgi:hypothetical protein